MSLETRIKQAERQTKKDELTIVVTMANETEEMALRRHFGDKPINNTIVFLSEDEADL